MKNYSEAIDWLFEQFPAYQKIGVAAYKPDLSNILSLCKQLGISYEKLPCIHIAGTNGKGSTSNMIASVCIENNHKTGLFTSPHIHDFRERITVNGKQISEERVISFCIQIQTLNLEVSPSFFEITWALALDYFIEQACTICVIETGLGGRLDATNILTPVLSVITNIGLDHMALLGNTHEQIATEKAGIIKSNIPVVIGETLPETKPVFETIATQKNAPIYWSEKQTWEIPFFYSTQLYQWKNERTVRTVFRVLNELSFHFSEEVINKGIANVNQNTGFRGRFEQINKSPLTLLDVAHNVDGIKVLLESILSHTSGKLHIVYGTSSDKDLTPIFELFPKDANYYFTEFTNLRSAKWTELREEAEKNDLNALYFQSVKQAVHSAQNTANENDTILITGSFFLISDFF